MSQDVILENKSLTLTVGYKTLFRELPISFPSTGLVLIEGENGAGKTTLLREIYLNGTDSPNWHWPLGKQNIGFLGHELGLYTSLPLEENLRYFSSLSKTSLSESEILSMVDFYKLTRRKKDPIYTYSRGMKQKAAILRTFVSNPKIILMDEPFTGLDKEAISLFTSHLNREKKDRLIVVVLHEIPGGLIIDKKISIGKEKF